MIRALAFLLMDWTPEVAPLRVRLFRRFMRQSDACTGRGEEGFGEFFHCCMWTEYSVAGPLVRAYLDSRYPAYVSLAKGSILGAKAIAVRSEALP